MMDQLLQLGWIILKILFILVPLILTMSYITMAERKVIAYMQGRIGPNRVGLRGIGQPIADAIKLVFKELIIPTQSSRYLFFIAPILTVAPSLVAWAVIPFAPGLVLANINAGILFLFAMTSLGIYGILIGGVGFKFKICIFWCVAIRGSISYFFGASCSIGLPGARINRNGTRGTHRLTQFTSNATFITIGITSKRQHTSKAKRNGRFFFRILYGCFTFKKITPCHAQASEQLKQGESFKHFCEPTHTIILYGNSSLKPNSNMILHCKRDHQQPHQCDGNQYLPA